MYSTRFPAKNRKQTGVEGIAIELADSINKVTVSPNDAAEMAFNERLPFSEESVGASCISGEPGYFYRTEEIEMILTRDEMLRLMRRELRPEEFRSLLEKYGMFFEVHDDFYEVETGAALQGMSGG